MRVLDFGVAGFCEITKTRSPRRMKTLGGVEARRELTQPTHGTGLESNSGHIAGGERCHHCAMPTPHNQEFITASV